MDYTSKDYQDYINFLYKRKPTTDESEKYYKADMHIHSDASYDSKMPLETIVNAATKKKLKYIGIADHVDFGNESTKDVVERIKRRNAAIDELQESTSTIILKGIEVGEPHLYPNETEYLKQILDTDYIIGSIHYLKGCTLRTKSKEKDVLNKYFTEVLNMIRYSDIDIIGHLDYIKRYHELDSFDRNILEQILESISCSDKALEINTSGIRRCTSPFPDEQILEEYIHLGGKRVTYGSDAHEESELFASIEDLSKSQKQLKLTNGVIIKHKFKSI